MHELPAPHPPARRRKSPPGEAQVWLTALGLTVGVCMVAGLLLLILVRGLAVFWPARVTEFTLREGAGSAIQGKTVVAGEIVRIQERRDGGGEEIQLHVGNKDVFGFNFHWLQSADILSRSEPADILMLERLEYGDAFGRPVALLTEGGAALPAADPGFRPRLAEIVHQAEATRDRIEEIEKHQIGAINRRLAKLELARKTNAAPNDDAARAALQVEYESLAAQARELRASLATSSLQYLTSTGEEKSLPTGEIVRIVYPNELGFGGRLGLFFSRLWEFFSEDPREANTEGGIFPAIFGTFVMTLLMSVMVTPLGVIAAIYLREYAKQGALVRTVRICVNNLAGVPSIVFGVFGLGFFVYVLGSRVDQTFFSSALPTPTFGTGGILWASLTLALLTLPVIIVATEEALAAVPRGVREAALACGASKWQMIQRVVLPSAAPGVLTGVILSMARGAGEVAPLMLVGVVKLAPSLPIDGIFPFIHPERKFMHLGFHIFDLGFQSPDSEAAKPMVFATTLLLIALVVVMNLAAILIRNHLRKKYAASTF
jgi:phosphate transport system permease protein